MDEVVVTVIKRWQEGIGGQWDVYCVACGQGVGGSPFPARAAAYVTEHLIDWHNA